MSDEIKEGQVVDGKGTAHYITEDDLKNNNGLGEDVKVGDLVFLPTEPTPAVETPSVTPEITSEDPDIVEEDKDVEVKEAEDLETFIGIERKGYTLYIVKANDIDKLNSLRATGKSMGEISVNCVETSHDHADEVILAIKD